jgi:hypothetical protein
MDKRKLTNDRQYHGHRETDKDRQYHGQREVSLCPWYCLSIVSFTLAMMLSVFCQFPFVNDIVCLLSVSLHTISWTKGNWQKTDNIMAKGKLTKTDNIMDKGKLTKTDNNRAKGKLTKACYCLSFVSFPLAMMVSVFFQFPFGHDIVFLLSVFLWPC